MPQCRLCKNDFPALIKAHIIPRSFYKRLRDAGGKPVMLTAGADRVDEKQHQSGLWNDDIVCAGCEARFGPYDEHGYAMLKDITKLPVFENPPGHPLAHLLQEVDYHRLKLFFLSVLWRAHWSSHRFFNHVDLGPHEPVIADFILRDVAPPPEVYSVHFYHLTGERYPNVMFPPWRHRVDGTNVYRFYFPGLVVLMTVDKRDLPPPWELMRLNDKPPYNVAFMPYASSAEEGYVSSMQAEIKKAKFIPKRMK